MNSTSSIHGKHAGGAPARLGSVLDEARARLAAADVPQPRLTAELTAAHVLDCPRLELVLRYDEALSDDQRSRLEDYLRRLLVHEPIQYVLGETEFMGHHLRIDARALVPRPETEVLVDEVLHCAPLWERPHPEIADVGTGSGCIAIALAKTRPQATYIGTDISPDALALACENALHCDVADLIQWRTGDLLSGIEDSSLDAIVANLPYIPAASLAQLPRNVRDFEPPTALDGGDQGISLISRLVEQAHGTLKSPGWIFLETGEDQARAVAAAMQDSGWRDVRVVPDLAGCDRVVSGRRP